MGRLLGASLIWAAMVLAQLQGFQGCVEEERVGLLALSPMKGINTSSDCCQWVGVNCSATTGRVERLALYKLRNDEALGSFLNISLFFPFRELVVLDLSSCDIRGFLHQADFVRMMSLKYLDVSNNSLNIINLEDVCKMNNIIELDLAGNSITGPLPDCVGNMTKLQFLNLDDNMLSGNIPPIFGNLSHLRYLSLAANYFEGSFSLSSLAYNSKLEYLDLSPLVTNLQLETETPTWFPSFQLKFLRLRNLNLNRLYNSVIPSFLLHQYDLRYIDLSHNKLVDSFPSWLIQNNSALSILSLRRNFLTGNFILPDFVHVLYSLDISSNQCDGKLPDGIEFFLPNLSIFNISRNRFEGSLPSSLGELQVLAIVDFSFNKFSGELPKNLFARSRGMIVINLSNNLLHGKISLNITNLPSLLILLLNSNKFNGTIEDKTIEDGLVGTYMPDSRVGIPLDGRVGVHMPLLFVFDISNNMISGRLPRWIKHFLILRVLKVSDNYFEGNIPVELCNMNLYYLDISRNKFSGFVPSCLGNSSVKSLSLRENNLTGAIPNGFLNNSNLVTLDLSYNDFSNRILPNWIYSLKNIQKLLMAGMQLEGEIPMQLCTLENIKILNLSHNYFHGSIPSCLFGRPFWVKDGQDDSGLDLGIQLTFVVGISLSYYNINSTLDFPKINIYREKALAGYEVRFTTKGASLRYQNDLLNYMTGLDLSNNKLSGQIPPQIEYSQALRGLNLSNNQLWGSIPSNISKMTLIESLDLSSNNLTGEIPSEIVYLNFISLFNVSNNNLSGPIPDKGQFSTFDERNYGGNKYLCGRLLHKNCKSSAPSMSSGEQRENETLFEMTWFWWTFVASYIFVVVAWAIVMGINPRWCRGLIRMVDAFCPKLYFIIIKW